MRNTEITILPPQDARLETFRRRVLSEDLNCAPHQADGLKAKSDFKAAFGVEAEEIYKFSRHKWERAGFEAFCTLLDGGEAVSAAGCRSYGSRFVRVGMHYYTLKKFRTLHRSPLWRSAGFVEAAMKHYRDAEGFFVTIYPHNRRLKAWAARLRAGERFAQMASDDPTVVGGRYPRPHLVRYRLDLPP